MFAEEVAGFTRVRCAAEDRGMNTSWAGGAPRRVPIDGGDRILALGRLGYCVERKLADLQNGSRTVE